MIMQVARDDRPIGPGEARVIPLFTWSRQARVDNMQVARDDRPNEPGEAHVATRFTWSLSEHVWIQIFFAFFEVSDTPTRNVKNITQTCKEWRSTFRNYIKSKILKSIREWARAFADAVVVDYHDYEKPGCIIFSKGYLIDLEVDAPKSTNGFRIHHKRVDRIVHVKIDESTQIMKLTITDIILGKNKNQRAFRQYPKCFYFQLNFVQGELIEDKITFSKGEFVLNKFTYYYPEPQVSLSNFLNKPIAKTGMFRELIMEHFKTQPLYKKY